MLRQLKNGVRLGALSLLLALVTVLSTPATQAGEWVGSWDPPYGAPFTTPNPLGWRGSALFDIPLSPPCNTSGAACVSGASVQSAEVIFFDANTDVDIAQINWTAAELTGVVTIAGLQFAGSTPVQFATSPFPEKWPVLYPGVLGVDYGNFDINVFALQFAIDYPISAPDASEFSGPLLFWRVGDCNPEFDECAGGLNDLSDPTNRPVLRVTLVPEPAGLALVAGALLALIGAAHRRRPKSRLLPRA